MKELTNVTFSYESRDKVVMYDAFVVEGGLPHTLKLIDEMDKMFDDLARLRCIQHDGKFLKLENINYFSV